MKSATAHSVVKFGVGSTSLADWSPDGGVFSNNTTPAAWLQAVRFIQDQERALKGWVAGLVWIQGEQDATSAPLSAAYGANLTYLMKRLRQFWPNLPVVIVRLSSSGGGAFTATVATAQTAYVAGDPKSALVNTDDLSLKGDLLHYTEDSLITLGQRCAAAMQTLATLSDPGANTTYSVDATSLLAKPNGPREWGRLLLKAGITMPTYPAPTWHQRCQDFLVANGGNGKLNDSNTYFPLAVGAGAPLLETAVAGWSTKGLSIATTADVMTSGIGVGPDHGAGSVFTILRILFPTAPAAERSIYLQTNGTTGGAKTIQVNLLTNGKLKLYSNNVNATTVNSHVQATPLLVGIRYNKTAGTLELLTSLEKLALSYAVSADGTKGFGALSGFLAHVGTVVLDHIHFVGANAELSDAQIKSLYQAMGETITW
jgi:hypothetical protein